MELVEKSMTYLCSRGVRGVTRFGPPLILRRVARASACASALVGCITRLPLRFMIAPVVSCATPNFLPTFTTLAINKKYNNLRCLSNSKNTSCVTNEET